MTFLWYTDLVINLNIIIFCVGSKYSILYLHTVKMIPHFNNHFPSGWLLIVDLCQQVDREMKKYFSVCTSTWNHVVLPQFVSTKLPPISLLPPINPPLTLPTAAAVSPLTTTVLARIDYFFLSSGGSAWSGEQFLFVRFWLRLFFIHFWPV